MFQLFFSGSKDYPSDLPQAIFSLILVLTEFQESLFFLKFYKPTLVSSKNQPACLATFAVGLLPPIYAIIKFGLRRHFTPKLQFI